MSEGAIQPGSPPIWANSDDAMQKRVALALQIARIEYLMSEWEVRAISADSKSVILELKRRSGVGWSVPAGAQPTRVNVTVLVTNEIVQ